MDAADEPPPAPPFVTAFGILVAVTGAIAAVAGASGATDPTGAGAGALGAWTRATVAMTVAASVVAADLFARRRGARPVRVWMLRLAGFLGVWVPFGLGCVPPSAPLAALPVAFGLDRAVRLRALAGPMLLVAAFSVPCLLGDAWVLARRARPADVGDYPSRVLVADPVLGYAAAPGTHRARRLLDGEVVYDVGYAIDGYGRRVVPGSAESAADGRPPLLLFGCSYVFGEGVGDEDTIAARLAVRAPEFRPVPYALCGWGPQHMLACLESGRVRRETPGRGGAAVYFLLAPDHDLRLHGTWTAMRWIARAPMYAFESGRVVNRGSFESAEPFRTAVTRRLQAWPAIDALMIRADAVAAASMDRSKLVRVVCEARRLHAEQFGGRFLVCVWPRAGTAAAPYVADLRAAGLDVLDLTGLQTEIARTPARYSIRWDGHPTRAYYELCADEIVAHLAATPR